MKVNNVVSFRADYQPQSTNLLQNPQSVKPEISEDSERILRLEEELNKLKAQQQELATPKKSKSFKDSVKTSIANVWKFFSVAGTMSYATAKGAAYGVVVGTGTLLAAILLRAPKFVKAEGFKAIFNHPFKAAGKVGTTIAALGAFATLAGVISAGKLEANQNSSVIEHKMDVAHVND